MCVVKTLMFDRVICIVGRFVVLLVDLQFLNNVIIIKTKVLLPQE